MTKKQELELAMFRRRICEAHQPLDSDTTKSCPYCEAVHLAAENKVLKQFAREIILDMCWDIPTSTMGDLCGGEIQDFAEKLGLIKQHIITEQEVNDYPGENFEVGETIYVLSEILDEKV